MQADTSTTFVGYLKISWYQANRFTRGYTHSTTFRYFCLSFRTFQKKIKKPNTNDSLKSQGYQLLRKIKEITTKSFSRHTKLISLLCCFIQFHSLPYIVLVSRVSFTFNLNHVARLYLSALKFTQLLVLFILFIVNGFGFIFKIKCSKLSCFALAYVTYDQLNRIRHLQSIHFLNKIQNPFVLRLTCIRYSDCESVLVIMAWRVFIEIAWFQCFISAVALLSTFLDFV